MTAKQKQVRRAECAQYLRAVVAVRAAGCWAEGEVRYYQHEADAEPWPARSMQALMLNELLGPTTYRLADQQGSCPDLAAQGDAHAIRLVFTGATAWKTPWNIGSSISIVGPVTKTNVFANNHISSVGGTGIIL